MLVEAARLATRIEPKVVVIENVAGALQGEHRNHWANARYELWQAGYRSTTLVEDFSRFGVPQRRRRALLVAWRSAPEPTFSIAETTSTTMAMALQGATLLADHDNRSLPAGSHSALIADRIAAGQKLSNVRSSPRAVHTWNIPLAFGEVTGLERRLLETLLRLRRQARVRDFGDADPVSARRLTSTLGQPAAPILRSLVRKGYVRQLGGLYDLTHTYNGRYRRPDPTGFSPTVDTKFMQARYFLHPHQSRAFSAREAARIQTFPDWFSLPASRQTAARLIGNAVPPLAAYQIAQFVRGALLPGDAG